MYTPSNTLLFCFIASGFGAIGALAASSPDSFIVLAGIADLIGLFIAFKHIRS
jgi:hypothetical protein